MTSENLSKKRLKDNICIIGGGYIGGNLTNHLLRSRKYNVFLVKHEFVDYHNLKELRRYLINNGIDYVINCSGFTGKPNVDEAELRKPECWELNVNSPLRMNQLCNQLCIRYLHISSGCIYSGYEKEFTEEDLPNFGLFDDSSFYSKSKHAFELGSKYLDNKIIRIRMPICNDLTNDRNYLKKIMNYPNLVNYTNSKTYIPDLCDFVENLLEKSTNWIGQDIYNVVNRNPYNTREVVEHLNIMNENNWEKLNPKWVYMEELNITAPRSNCVLDNTKANEIFKLHTEYEIMNMVCNYNNGIQGA